MKPFKPLLSVAIAISGLWFITTKGSRQHRKLCRQADLALQFVTQNPGINILAPDYTPALEIAIDWLEKARPQLPACYAGRIDAAFEKVAEQHRS